MTLALVVAGWLIGWVLLWRRPVLPLGGRPRGTVADLSVIIPARDEAATLPALLDSLQRQVERPLEVVVVDDASTDRTSTVAALRGATVVTAPPLPAGWVGKPWASHIGLAETTGAHVLFLDADVRLAADALPRLVAAHEGGLLSVQPHHEVARPYEHLSAIPNVVALLASGIAAVRPSPRPGLAFGPCLLTSRADLEAVGGFASVADEVLEDVALARRYEAAGFPVTCRLGADVVRFRMFPDGVRSLVQGWARTLTGGARAARPLPMLGALVWVSAVLAVPLVDLPLLPFAWLAFAAQLWWMLRRVGSFRWWAAPLFPVLALSFVGLFAWSAVQRVGRRRVTWRGRHLDVGRA